LYSILTGKEADKTKKFELASFTEEVEARDKKRKAEADFRPDRPQQKDNEFVLGGFDFEYGGGYRRDEIMKKTLDEADAMIADAKARVSAIERDAYEKGLAEGHEAGKTESSAEVSFLIGSLKDCVQKLTGGRNEFYAKAEKEMVDLVILVASEILVKEIKEDRDIITEVIRKAVGELHSKQSVTIRLNNADVEMAVSMHETFLKEMDDLESLEIVVDNSITPGGCILKTNVGMIDATVEGRLADIHRNLKAQLGQI